MEKCILNDKFQRYLNDYVKSFGFSSYDIEVSPGGQGKNFIGLVYRVSVSGIKNGKKCTLKLYLKTESDCPARIKEHKLNEKYERESYMYNNVLNTFRDIQKCLKITDQMTIPICFKATDEYIIMDDYNDKGYSPFDHDKTLDFNHVALVISELAKFHAFSFVLKQKDPSELNEMAKNLTDLVYLNDHFKGIIELMLKMALDDIVDQKVKERLASIGVKMFEKLNTFAKQTEETNKYSVVCHSDSTLRNILFKYNKDRTPYDAVMLDYQFSKYSSPVTDIYFTLVSSTSAEIWDRLNELVDIYYVSLTDFLDKLGYDVSECYPENVFHDDLVKFRTYAVGVALSIVRIFAIPPRDSGEISEIFENQENADTYFDIHSDEANKLYKENINAIMNEFVEIGFI